MHAPHGPHWTQPRRASEHELRDADAHVLGSLRFLPRPAITWGYTDRRRARAEAGGSTWNLSIEWKGFAGFFGLAGRAHVDDGRTGILDAGPFFSTGVLSLAGGRRFRWKGSLLEAGAARSSTMVADCGVAAARDERRAHELARDDADLLRLRLTLVLPQHGPC